MVKVELNPEEQLKMESGIFLKGNTCNISAIQIISNDGVNNRYLWYDSFTSLGKTCNGFYTLWLPHRKYVGKA